MNSILNQYLRALKSLSLVLLLTLPSFVHASECNKAPKGIAVLHQLRPTWFSVRGPLADFDPCHSSVSLSIPSNLIQPPLIILIHGGIGLSKSTQMAAHEFRKMGFATLVFDAFEMNHLGYLGWEFFNTQMTNEARQRMIFKVTRGAFEWAVNQKSIDSKKIYFWGNSNGAAVAVNMAGIPAYSHAKGVVASGLPPVGLGLPNKIFMPIFLAFGESDNYGTDPSKKLNIWNRPGFCRENTSYGNLSARNSLDCNDKANQDASVETVFEWYQRLKIENNDIFFKIYKDAAHDFFSNGPIMGAQVKNGALRGYNTGATQSARLEFLSDLKKFFSDEYSKTR